MHECMVHEFCVLLFHRHLSSCERERGSTQDRRSVRRMRRADLAVNTDWVQRRRGKQPTRDCVYTVYKTDRAMPSVGMKCSYISTLPVEVASKQRKKGIGTGIKIYPLIGVMGRNRLHFTDTWRHESIYRSRRQRRLDASKGWRDEVHKLKVNLASWRSHPLDLRKSFIWLRKW